MCKSHYVVFSSIHCSLLDWVQRVDNTAYIYIINIQMNVMSAVAIPMTSCDMYVCHGIMCDMYVMYLHSQLVETWSSGGVCIYVWRLNCA